MDIPSVQFIFHLINEILTQQLMVTETRCEAGVLMSCLTLKDTSYGKAKISKITRQIKTHEPDY